MGLLADIHQQVTAATLQLMQCTCFLSHLEPYSVMSWVSYF